MPSGVIPATASSSGVNLSKWASRPRDHRSQSKRSIMNMSKIRSNPRTPSGRSISSRLLLVVFATAVASLAFAPFSPVVEDSPKTPDEALAKLMAGNRRFVEQKTKATDIKLDNTELAAGQAPFAAVIRCADSRVAPEICFDQPLGRLFVCGVAGNIPTEEGIASLEFGVAVLGAKLIVVMGHSGCGAVKAAIEHRSDTSVLPGSLPGLVNQIVSPCALSVDPEDPEALAKATRCNANGGVTELLKRSPVLREAVANGKLRIVAGVQDLATGRFTLTRK